MLELVHADLAELIHNNSKHMKKVLWKQAWPLMRYKAGVLHNKK
jgi:hypothetical protein